MKKWFVFMAILLFIPTVHADEATIRQQLVKVVITKDEAMRTKVEPMMKRLMAIDAKVLETIVLNGVVVRLIDHPITEEPEYKYLAGTVPRGWEKTGKTWDDVPGIGGQVVLVRIGYSDQGKGHGSVNLELHETAHAIDTYASGRQVGDIEPLMKLEKKAMYGDDPYYNYPEEYFAESFAHYYLNATTRDKLKAKAPKTYAYMEQLIANIGKKLTIPRPTATLTKTTITGNARKWTTVYAKRQDGKTWTAATRANGTFTINIDRPLQKGDRITLYARSTLSNVVSPSSVFRK